MDDTRLPRGRPPVATAAEGRGRDGVDGVVAGGQRRAPPAGSRLPRAPDVTATMRWRGGRSGFVRPGEVFDPSGFGAEPVPEREARDFVARHHYSRSYPAAILAVGLRRAGGGLVGVAVFSVPMRPRAADAYGAAGTPSCDLGRLVLLDDVPFNAETWFLRRALATLGRERPAPGGGPAHGVVLAYSDPVPRSDAGGRVVLRGHVGHAYGPAGSALYLGRATPRTLCVAPDGTVVSERALSKLRRGEQGERYAYEALRAHGAPPIRPGEDGAAYVRRALSEGPFRRMRHPGNHVYAFPCGDRGARRRVAGLMATGLPYPGRSDAWDAKGGGAGPGGGGDD